MLSAAVQYLLNSYKEYFNSAEPSPETVMVHVDEVASKFAQAYEQIRNLVDYREEHLLRQHSISRALKRAILLNKHSAIGEILIKEMIRSGYFPNDKIPESKIPQVQNLINNLIAFIDRAKKNGTYRRGNLSSWLVAVTASAIEECVDPPEKDRAAAGTMLMSLKENLVISGRKIDDSDRDIQLFIAIQRALLRVDEDQLSYRLFKELYPYWENPTPEQFEQIANNLLNIKRTLDAHMNSPLSPYFFKLCNQLNTIFLLLGDVTFNGDKPTEEIQGMFDDETKLTSAISFAYGKRFEKQKRGLRRIAIFSVISLFLTKIVIALGVEIPLDKALGTFSLQNTIVSILFPALLMAFIVALIRLPGKKNLDLVQTEVKATVYQKYNKKRLLNIPQRNKATHAIANLAFFLISVYILWITYQFLINSLKFSILSSTVLILFTSIVAATGVKVQNRARDVSVEPVHASILSFIIDLIFMPFVAIGRFTIAGLSHFKALVLLINLIDAPFQVLILSIEHLNVLLRGKKEEMY